MLFGDPILSGTRTRQAQADLLSAALVLICEQLMRNRFPHGAVPGAGTAPLFRAAVDYIWDRAFVPVHILEFWQ